MKSEVSVRHLLKEILKKHIIVIVVAILCAGIFGGHYFYKTKTAVLAQQYGAYGELYIKSAQNTGSVVDKYIIDNKSGKVIESSESFSDVIPMLTCNEVIDSITNDPSIVELNLEQNEIRSSIYPRGEYNNRVISFNVVFKDQNTALLICDKLIEYSVKNYIDNGFDVEVREAARSIGVVTIDIKDSNLVQGEKVYIVNQIQPIEVTLIDVLKQTVLGFVFGCFIISLIICIRFILRNRIVYPEQLQNCAGIRLVAHKKGKENKYLDELYSNLVVSNENKNIIGFYSMYKLQNNSIIYDFANLISTFNKNVLIIEPENKDILNVPDTLNCDHMKINNEVLLNTELINDLFNQLRKKHDFILFMLEDVESNPLLKIGMKACDRVVLMVEPDMISIENANKEKSYLESMDIIFEGAVFFEG